jgi:hypothetical protein
MEGRTNQCHPSPLGPLLHSNACPAAVLRDKLDAGFFKGRNQGIIGFNATSEGLAVLGLKPTDGGLETPDRSAKSSCDQPNSERVALI